MHNLNSSAPAQLTMIGENNPFQFSYKVISVSQSSELSSTVRKLSVSK